MSGNNRKTGFASSRLDRRSQLRSDASAVEAAFAGARCILLAGDRPVLRLTGENAADPLFTRDEARAFGADEDRRLLLGHDAAGALFALPLPAEFEHAEILTIDLRSIAVQGLVGEDLLGPLAQAKSLLDWHARHGFCANCGHATRVGDAGYRRDCGRCGAHHFPRTDPVAIMLVTRGDQCLLAHEPRFREGMVSTLAGFIEPGETIEDAVRREVREEVGLVVGGVAYHKSQPWPFPSSLMIGCLAEARAGDLVIDETEIVWARWFGRQDVARMIEGTHPEGLFVPPPMAIAHHLLRHFLDG